jgi:hypothetical protein
MGPWTDVFNALPSDGQQVWVRRDWFSDPQVMFYRSRDHTFGTIYADATAIGYGGDTTNETFYGVATTDQNTFMRTPDGNLYFGWYDGDQQFEVDSYPPSGSGTTQYAASPPLTSPISMSRQDGGPGGITFTLARTVPWYEVSRWATYP